jgi:hypothetical protein
MKLIASKFRFPVQTFPKINLKRANFHGLNFAPPCNLTNVIKGWSMKCLCLLFCLFILVFSFSTYGYEEQVGPEEIYEDEIQSNEEIDFDQAPEQIEAEEDSSYIIGKAKSLKEIILGLRRCKKSLKDSLYLDNNEHRIYALSCYLPDNQIFTAEILIKANEPRPFILSYQEMIFSQSNLSKDSLKPLMLSNNIHGIKNHQNPSPGISALLALAKVGVPLSLTFKTAKLIAPSRSDWQKHFIAGSIISGFTILTSEGLLRSYNTKHVPQMSDFKINLLSSLAGLLCSVTAGISKEIYDRFTGKGHPEVNDAIYTAAGGAMISISVVIPIELIFKSKKSKPIILRSLQG